MLSFAPTFYKVMKKEKIAILDLGTNTFNLLLAEVSPMGQRIFFNTKIPVKIGMGGINEGLITQEARERALKAVHQYHLIIEEYGISKVFAYGTSAFRNATNGRALGDEIQRRFNIPVDIISGEQEAIYIYHGVQTALNLGSEVSLIMDIGGGSVEMIIGNNENVFWKKSFEIGAQRLLDNFHKHDPILPTELNKLNKYLNDALIPLDEAVKKFKPVTLIGSSGTFDTLSNIYCEKYNINYKQVYPEFPLSLDFFLDLNGKMKWMTRNERVNIPGMLEMRADMMVVACGLIEYVIMKYLLKHIRVSAYSLKEGMVSLYQKQTFGTLRITA